MASRHGYVRAPLDAAHLHANTTAQAVEGNLGGFCVYNSGIEVSRDVTWPSAGALARIACCGRLRWASHGAQPSSSAARAVFFAIGSWTVCGMSERELNAIGLPRADIPCRFLRAQRTYVGHLAMSALCR